jgi:predicted DNA-binding protein (MmcQ/YjbR family)
VSAKLKKMAATLRSFALDLPGAYEEYPWGERVAKVNKKVFVFLGRDDDDGEIGFSVKLPDSGDSVLNLPFAEPTGYGLGKAGWVSVTLSEKQMPPLDVLRGWIAESYRAVAPKKLIKQLDGGASEAPIARRPSRRRASR